MSLFEIQNITYRYSEEEPAVFEDFSLSVEKGQCLVLHGDNGCGKTTLFRLISGLAFPEKGQIIFDGIEINQKYLNDNYNSRGYHKRVGMLFQNPDVMLFCSKVYDEIAFGPRQMGLSEDEVRKRVSDCMEMLSITDLSDKAPYHLSGGQKKRVALASVIALNPEIYILDEPFAGLDKSGREWMLGFLEKLKEAGKTLLIATHEETIIDAIQSTVLEL